MKFTYNWLKEYVDLTTPADELSDILTMAGLEVEALTYLGEGLDNIVTVKINDVKAHPNADKLSLCDVTDGKESYEIVCGAKNMKAGDTVALAKEGATLPNGITIKPTNIRGVTSNGMLCSETELNLADESAGIMILPEDTKTGTPLVDVLGLDDHLFEIGLTPNRSDCLSLLGIANEVSILTGAKLKPIEFNLTESANSTADAVSVEIQDPDACHRYTARLLRGVTIKESARIIRARLNAVGVRAINNIVDITNYVLFVYGQPLHAFDHAKVAGGRIVVKCAKDGEKFMTLDEKERVLTSGDLMICDGERSVALGGVMGGMNSEVSENTKDVLLESAYFDPSTVRRTARRLGLASESSHRFERGVNPVTVPTASDYAAYLMQQSTGCEILNGMVDVHPAKYEERTVTVRFSRVNRVLGTDFSNADILDIVKRQRLTINTDDTESIEIQVPPERHDLVQEIDVIEDIARIYGYNNIPVTLPKIVSGSRKKSRFDELNERVLSLLTSNGYCEAMNYSFYSPEDVKFFSLEKEGSAIKILNPLTDDQSVMRMSLLPGLIGTAKRNINHKNNNLKMFEFGRTYRREGSESIVETVELAGIITGNRYLETWGYEKNSVDFFDIKGIVELVLENIKVIEYIIKSGSSKKWLHPTVSMEFYAGNDLLGVIGELHPTITEGYGIDQKVYIFDFDFDKLVRYSKEKVTFESIPKYPYIKRDIAFLLDADTPCSDIVAQIKSHNSELVEDVTVFDLYEGKQTGEGKKSIAFRITYRDRKKTLNDEEVNGIMDSLSKKLEKRFNISVRK